MKETSKAMRRRWLEDADGAQPWNWKSIFTGHGIDVGPGDNPLPFEDCLRFDMEQGDANKLGSYFAPETFNYIHASQVLEHMHDPLAALCEWNSLLKPGGHSIISVPEMSLYGDILWGEHGSRYNPDHKATFSFGLRNSGAPIHIYLPDFVSTVEEKSGVKCIFSRVVDTNYDYKVGFTRDQTYHECDGVEAWVELLFRRV